MKAEVVRALDALGWLDRLLWLRGRLGVPVLAVLTYHRIAEPAEVGEFDPDVRETSARGLAAQLAVMQARGTLVSLDDVRGFVLQGKRPPPNPMMLTFDDGYVDCHDVVLPLLKKAGVPATFFVTTAYPESGRLFWWDRITLLLRRSREEVISLHLPPSAPRTFDLRRDPEGSRRALLKLVKRTPGLSLDSFFEQLERALGVTLSPSEERALAGRTIMSFRQIRALREAGMGVASHSHEHRVLTTLSPAEVFLDLARSRRMLGELLDEDVRTVAYPVGYRLAGPRLSAVKEAGFDLGFTNASGLCLLPGADPWNVPRIAVDAEDVGARHKGLLLLGQRPYWRLRSGFSGLPIS